MDSKFAQDYKQLLRWLIISAGIIALIAINYCSLSEHMASNNKYVTDYSLPEDYEERNRPTVVAGIFYKPAMKHQVIKANLQNIPRILVVPPIEDVYSTAIADKVYDLLAEYKANIKNILMIASSKDTELKQGIGIVNLGDKFSENQTIIESLIIKNKAKLLKENAQQERFFQKQIEPLDKKLKKPYITPIVYKGISAQELFLVLEEHIKNRNTLVVFIADLSEKTVNENDSIAEQTVILLSKQNDLRPKIIDYTSIQKGRQQKTERELISKDETTKTLLDDVRSLQEFKLVHEEEIKTVAKEALNQAVFEGKKYKPSRKDYKDAMFDKGAVYITLKKQGQKRAWSGSVLATQGLARNISENIYIAAKEDKRFENIQPQEMPDISINISLLSGFQEIKYRNEQDLLEKLVPEKDGVVIRSGDRQAVFLPSAWKEFPDKQRFLNELKLKAGLSPIYWSNKIKVYRFYTVEIN